MSDLKLYYAPGTCALAPHIVLEEVGIAFEPVAVDIKAGEQRTPEYLKLNPKGRVPVLLAGDWVLTENVAILQFLARSHPEAKLWPEDLRDQAKAMEWFAWLASTVHVTYAHIRRAERYASSEAGLEEVRTKGLETCRALWLSIERQLGDGPWLLGAQYTAADAYLLVFWIWGRGLGFDMERDHPRWTAHARRMAPRPAVQKAFSREGIALPS